MRLVLLSILLMSCSPANLQQGASNYSSSGSKTEKQIDSGNASPVPNQTQPPSSQLDKEERADIPGNISGTHLACIFLTEAKDDNLLSTVGCRFQDSEGKRAVLSNLAKEATFSFEPGPNAEVTTALKRLPPEADYDAQLDFRGPSRASIQDAALSTRISVKLTDLTSGQAEALVSTFVENPKGSLWERDAASDSDKNGLCNDLEDCIYRARGLFWAREAFVNFSWQNAGSHCASRTYGGAQGWRLPTKDELFQAYLDGILELKAITALNLDSKTYRWSGEDGPVGGSRTAADFFATDKNSVLLELPPATQGSALCVRGP